MLVPLLQLDCGEAALAAEGPGFAAAVLDDAAARLPAPGGEVDLWFAPGKARVFDAGDGRRVG